MAVSMSIRLTLTLLQPLRLQFGTTESGAGLNVTVRCNGPNRIGHRYIAMAFDRAPIPARRPRRLKPERGLCKPPNRSRLREASCRRISGAKRTEWGGCLHNAYAARRLPDGLCRICKRFARRDRNLSWVDAIMLT